MPMAGFAGASANYPPMPPSSQLLPPSPGVGLLHPPPVLPPPQAAMAGMRFSAPPGIGRAPPVLPFSHPQGSYASSSAPAGGASMQQPYLQAKFCVDKEVDLAQLVLELKEFASQAEKTLQDVMNLIHLEDPVSGPPLASCPFNPNHRIPALAAFKHSLLCPSSTLGLVEEDLDVLSSLHYPHTAVASIKALGKSSSNFGARVSLGNASASVISAIGDACQKAEDSAVVPATQKSAFASLEDFGLTGGNFSYKDAPAVVQASSFRSNPDASISLPPSIKAEIRSTSDISESSLSLECNESVSASEKASSFKPSKLWLLHEELEAWRNFPSHYSPTVLEVAMGLDCVDQETLCQKLIVSSSSYKLPLDSYLACHISMLLKLCLLAIRKEAGEHFKRWDSCVVSEGSGNDNYMKNKHVTEFSGKELSLHDRANPNIGNQHEEANKLMIFGGERREDLQTAHLPCPVLLECGDWLASCLMLIYQPMQAKLIVLEMFKHSLICAGHVLTSSYFEPLKQEEGHIRHQCVGMDVKSMQELHSEETFTSVQNDSIDKDMYTDKKSWPELWQVEAAIDALNERSYMEEFFEAKVSLAKLTKDQFLRDYDNIVSTATRERLKRPNLRAVLEHDGLNSNRQENQGTKRYKTKEELLAEERDYKRRRMSYRGKKIRRTPSQVIHDIIEAHMEEIMAAGGIGCFGKAGSELQISGNNFPETRQSYQEHVEKLSELENDDNSPQRSRNYHSSSHKDTPQRSLGDREGRTKTHARTESVNRDYRLYRLDRDKSPHGVNRDSERYHKNERENRHYDDSSDANSRSSLSRGTSHDRHQTESNRRERYENRDKSYHRYSDESKHLRWQADDEYESRKERSSVDSKDFPEYKTDKSSEYKKRMRDHW